MEERKLNEKESLELISQMIQNTQQKLIKHSGIPFLTWGYVSAVVSLIVWILLKNTQNYLWNYLWFLIPAVGYAAMYLMSKNREKGVKTYIDKVIAYIWIGFAVTGFTVSASAIFLWSFPILFIILLLMGTGTAITGMVIQFKPITVSGFLGVALSFGTLLIPGYNSILIFALIFLIMMVIPGHILNYKSKKSYV
ncbi:MAG: hypothetical protein ACK5L7_06605 [Paludibacteraceae bacterium]